MRHLKKIILAAALAVLVFAPPAWAQDADRDARMQAAKEYLQVQDVSGMVDQMLEQLAKNPQSHISDADLAALRASMDMPALKGIALDGLVNTFTAEEMKTMTQFYGSPTGQSIVKKMPNYVAQVLPSIQQMVIKGLIEYKKKQAEQSPPAEKK
jgi:hypothetical protein